MTQEEIFTTIKSGLSGAGVACTPEMNKALYAVSGQLKGLMKQTIKASKPKKDENLSDLVKHYMENPMTPEDEAKGLRAMLHAGIAGGDIPAPLLDRLNQIIGVNSGKDDKIEVVDFKDAYPDYAECIRISENPKPEITDAVTVS